MSDDARDQSRRELTALMQNDDLGPATQIILTSMFWAFRELDGIDKVTGLYGQKHWVMIRHERTLEKSLAKDEECLAATRHFRALYTNNLLLRYGNYDQFNALMLKAGCPEAAKEAPVESERSTRLTWGIVLGRVEAERKRTKLFDDSPADNMWEAAYRSLIHPKPSTKSESPISYLLTHVAELCHISFSHAVFEIQEHVERRECNYSRLDWSIAIRHEVQLSQMITRDTYALDMGILTRGFETLKDDILQTLNAFKKKYFKEIETRIEEASGIPKMTCYLISDEYNRQHEARKAAKLAFDVRCLTEAECEETVARAKGAKPYGRDWMDAHAKLLEAKAKIEWPTACHLSQGDAKAMMPLKECVVEYQRQDERRVIVNID